MILAKDIPDIIRANFKFKKINVDWNFESQFKISNNNRLVCYWGGVKGIRIYNNNNRALFYYDTGENVPSTHALRFPVL